MNEYSNFVLGTLLVVSLLSILFSFRYRNRMSNMAAMTVSMALGMNMGISAGIYFGFMYQGDLFYSTIISILTGILAGVAAGFAFGVLPSVEGLMAGMMGGMMGAMLGEMVSKLQAVSLLNIFLTITVCSLFLYLVLSKQKETKDTRVISPWLLKPVFTFIVLLGYFYFGNQLDKNSIIQMESPKKPTEQIKIQVHPSNFSYTPSEINLSKNKPVLLTFTNHDSIEHDIVIQEMPILPITSQENDSTHGTHDSHGAGLHLHASPHDEKVLSFTPTESGKYEFYCSLPGHKESGMVGIIVVK